MGKGEIPRYEHFLLFPQCFQKVCFPGASKGVIVWEWVKPANLTFLHLTFLNETLKRHFFTLTLSKTSPGFYVSAVQVFLKHCGKRRNCSLRAISPFPTVFSILSENFLSISSNSKLSSANSLSLEESKSCQLGKG